MAIIDGKGRVFGKINVIDIMVILFIILVIAVGAKFVLVKPDHPAWITVEVMAKNQSYTAIETIETGSLILDSSGNKIGEVLAIYASPRGMKWDITLYLNLSIEKRSNKLYFANNELNINGNIDITLGHTNIQDANIISINKSLSGETKAIVEVIFKDTKPWVAEKITKGDTETNSQGRIIAKIISKESIPASMIVTSDAGEIYIREHPELKDVTAVFEIIAKKMGTSLSLHNEGIKIGKNFNFYADEYDISGTIINIS